MAVDNIARGMAAAAMSGGGGGGSGGVLVVNWNDDTGALDKTWQEIHDAPFASVISDHESSRTISFVSYVSHPVDNEYSVAVCVVDSASGATELVWFVTTSASGYPVIEEGD